MRRILLTGLALGGVAAFGGLVAYGVTLVVRGNSFYAHVKTKARDFTGSVHRPDHELGFVPIPGGRGTHLFPIGDDIAMQFDADGFRVPVGVERGPRRRPLILTLGDSCTYGDACPAEAAYPYQLAQLLNGSELNAGVCGYGLAQMYVIAARLIPRYKPDVVVVQYSPWLVSRAMNPFAPSWQTAVPVPFFFDDANDALGLHGPVGPGFLLRLPSAIVATYRTSPVNLGDRLSFLLQVAAPAIVRNDLLVAYYHTMTFLHLVPAPSHQAERIVRHVYEAIADVCRANGARMIVLVLGNGELPVDVPSAFHDMNLEVVNADKALFSRLPEKNLETYYHTYAHYRGTPPELVDPHPNALAHAIIAQELANAIAHRAPGPAHRGAATGE